MLSRAKRKLMIQSRKIMRLCPICVKMQCYLKGARQWWNGFTHGMVKWRKSIFWKRSGAELLKKLPLSNILAFKVWITVLKPRKRKLFAKHALNSRSKKHYPLFEISFQLASVAGRKQLKDCKFNGSLACFRWAKKASYKTKRRQSFGKCS